MKRYGNIDYFLSIPFKSAVKLFTRATKEEETERLYRFWLARYPLYNTENFESFDEFCEKLKPTKIEKSTEEIMAEIVPFYRLQEKKRAQ